MWCRPYCLLLLLCFSLPTLADTLWLDNGDRLTGKIELLEGSKLVIVTDFAGRVTVDVKRIRTLESDRTLLVKTLGQAERAMGLMASDTPGSVLLVNGLPEPQELPISAIRQMLEPQPVIEDWVWEGKANVALDIKDAETDQRDLDVSIDTQARHGDWRHGLAYEFERDFRNDVKSRHRWESEYDLSWFFADQWFWQTSAGYQRDLIGDIERRIQFGMGPGYEWWNSALGRFETSARLDYLQLDERTGETWHTNALALEWDYRRFLFGKRFQLFHKAETLIPDDDAIRYAVDAELGLRYLLNSWMALSLSTEWDYLKTTDDTGTNYKRYRLGLGVNW